MGLGLGARPTACCVRTRSCELQSCELWPGVGPRHLGSKEQKWGPGLRFAARPARLLGRPSGRAERSALGGAPARCICRSGRTPYSRALAADPADPADKSSLTSPGRPAFLTATCSLQQHRAEQQQCSVPVWYLPTGLIWAGLLSPPPSNRPSCALPFSACFPCFFLFPHPPGSSPVLTVNSCCTVPRARALPCCLPLCDVSVADNKRGTPAAKPRVSVAPVNGCTCTCAWLGRYQEVPAQYLFLALQCHILLLLETRTRFSSFHHREGPHLITESSRSSSREATTTTGQHLARFPASVLVLGSIASLQIGTLPYLGRLAWYLHSLTIHAHPHTLSLTHIRSPRSPPLNHSRRRRCQPVLPSDPRLASLDLGLDFWLLNPHHRLDLTRLGPQHHHVWFHDRLRPVSSLHAHLTSVCRSLSVSAVAGTCRRIANLYQPATSSPVHSYIVA